MLTTQQIQELVAGGGDVVSQDGDKIGSVGQIYLDDQSSQPEWVTARTGLFGTAESFVPLAGADTAGKEIRVRFGKDQVKGAPRVEASGHLTQEQEAELYSYYGLQHGGYDSDPGLQAPGAVGHDTSGPTTDSAMTRSEEQVTVGTADQEAGRARLRKYVVTEEVTQTVPVRKEKAVLEREPVTGTNVDAAMGGPAISEEEHEVVLHEERPVVEKEAVPVERVRLGTEEVAEEATVTEEVRKERIEAEGDIDDRR